MARLARAAFLILAALSALHTVAEEAPAAVRAAVDVSADFELPPGFRIELYAGDELAHDIFAMTLDALGHVVVAGPGYIKTLFDDDGDGRADGADLFSTLPASGAQGLLFDGSDLLFTGDGLLGRLRDADSNGHADGPPESWAKLRGGEHGAHAILRGPDGWFYVVCGNDAGVSAAHITAKHSPVREPRSGAILRISRDGKETQVLAHGFRNPYDIAFSPSGQLFTVDSDGERDHHLPWYAPTRLFDVAIGREHGWLSGGHVASWSRPASWADNVPRAAELGRGSPTGLVCCRHRAFPQRYRGGLFSAEWTFGRVYFLPLTPSGSTFTSQPEVFLQSRGSSGFAPVDLEIGPRGDLFVAMGGRRTQGSVYRIYYAGEGEQPVARDATEADVTDGEAHTKLLSVFRADQPLSAWSRAQWIPAARELGQGGIEAAIVDESLPVADRVRAIEIVTELWGSVSSETAILANKSRNSAVRARLAWSLGRSGDRELVGRLLRDRDVSVARVAWESSRGQLLLREFMVSLHDSDSWRDRYCRGAAIAATNGQFQFEGSVANPQDPDNIRLRLLSTWLSLDRPTQGSYSTHEQNEDLVTVACDAKEVSLRLEALRLLMLALGDVDIESPPERGMVGYVAQMPGNVSAADRAMLAERLTPLLPSGDTDLHRELDRELARVLAMLEADVPGLPERVTAKLTESSTPQDDLHYLFALSRIGGPRTQEVTSATAAALVGLHGKLAARGEFVSRTWPLRVTEAFQELCRRDPNLSRAVAEALAFGLPEHAMFVLTMPEVDRPTAARRLLAAVVAKQSSDAADSSSEADDSDTDASTTWTTELVQALACLNDDELFPALRQQGDDPNVRDAIVLVLGRAPQVEDAERFVAALDSFERDVVMKSATALASLPNVAPSALLPSLRALDRSIRDDEQAALAAASKSNNRSKPTDRNASSGRAVRAQLVVLVERLADRKFAIDEQDVDATQLGDTYKLLFDWFRAAHPSEAAALEQSTTVDLTAWRTRLAAIDWSTGSVEAGRAVFERQSCHRCHRGGERRGNDRLGPDLAGAAARFSREDLFAAIVDPSRNVAPLYHTTIITTHDGRVFQGLIVYESPDGTLLQTGPDTTVRITGDELASQRGGEQSLMPTGLLAGLSDEQLADLDAYLRSLAGEAAAR